MDGAASASRAQPDGPIEAIAALGGVVETTRDRASDRRLLASAVAGGIVAGIGLTVVAGWLLGLPTLARMGPYFAAMKVNTALALIASGAAIVLVTRRPAAIVVHRLVVLAGLLLPVATLLEYVTATDFGIDNLVVRDTVSSFDPGRMSFAAALGLSLVGLALLALDSRRAPAVVSQVLAIGALLIAVFGLVGYLYGVQAVYRFWTFNAVSLPGAFALTLLAGSILLARPDRGFMAAAWRPGPGGILIRRLLPRAAAAPVVLGLVVIAGQRLASYVPEFGITTLVTATVVLFVALIWQTAAAVERAEDALRAESAERLRVANLLGLVLDSAPLGVLAYGRDGRIVLANEFVGGLTGRAADDLIGRHYSEITTPQRQQAAAAVMARALAGLPIEPYTAPLQRRDGGTTMVRVVFASMYDGETLAGTVALTEDVTDRLRLEEQLRQAQKMEAIGGLAGGIAHDFNNLLTAINGYAGLISESAEPDGSVRRWSAEIAKAGDRAAELTRQLLAFGRKQVLQPDVYDPNELLDGMKGLLRRLIREDITLDFELEPTVGNIRVDRVQFEQIVLNLVVNARDAMPTGGRIVVETRRAVLDEGYVATHPGVSPGRYVMIAVTDTGIGMDESTRTRIFEPFFTTKRIGEGTGLGLAVVYGIVQQSAGSVWVYSEPGRGTTFRVYLPSVAGAAARPVARAAPASRLEGRPSVLLVEDDEAVSRLVTSMLEWAGCEVTTARDGPSGVIAATMMVRLDALLTDVILPGLNGPDVARTIRVDRPGTPILFLSGYASHVLGEGLDHLDDAGYLEKPFSREALVRTLRGLLDGAAARTTERPDQDG